MQVNDQGVVSVRHAMVDIETLGTEAGYIVLSIGVVISDAAVIGGKLEVAAIDSFYYKLSQSSQHARGYKVDTETVKWWTKQSDEARAVLEQGPEDLGVKEALMRLLHDCMGKDIDFWWSQHGMDYNMLSWLYDDNAVSTPWNFWQVKDLATLRDTHPIHVDRSSFVAHDALGDALYQTEVLSQVLKGLYTISPALVAVYTGD